MSRLIVHIAVPDSKREIAATMTGLSGLPEEFSVALDTIPNGLSDLWDEQAGYSRPGKYWGASQALAEEVCIAMQSSAPASEADAWYCAVVEGTGQVFQTNVPELTDGSWQAFLTATGLKLKIIDVGIFG
jgi:hypothetical protein